MCVPENEGVCDIEYEYSDGVTLSMSTVKVAFCRFEVEDCLNTYAGLIHGVSPVDNAYKNQNVDCILGVNENSPLFETIKHLSFSLHPSVMKLKIGYTNEFSVRVSILFIVHLSLLVS